MSSFVPNNSFNEQTAELPLEVSPGWPANKTSAPSHQPLGNSTSDHAASLTSSTSEVPFPATGSLLRKRYVLGEILGRGGAAIVYRAQDLETLDAGGKPGEVALKLLRPDCYQRAVVIERLKKEFQLAHTISHPNSVRIYDLDRHDSDGREIWFTTMELLVGRNLAALLASSTTPLSVPRIREILVACGSILTFAHERNVIHGDFKPGNVFVTRSDEVRVLDFGNAHQASAGTPDVQRAATFCYASPEVLMGLQPTPGDDVFSLSCVAYELFNGRHPYDRRSTLEALTAKLRPARPWTLGERQWLALQAALSFVRDRRPPMKTLLAELFPEETSAVPIAEQRAATPRVESSVTATHTADVIKPNPESMQRRIRDYAGTRRSVAATTLLGLLGLASIIGAWRIFGPVHIPAGAEVRSEVDSMLPSVSQALQRMRFGDAQAYLPGDASNPPQRIPPVAETSAPPTVDIPPATGNAELLVRADETAARPTRQIVSPSTRRTEPAVSSYVSFADVDYQVGEQTSAAAIGIKRASNLTASASVRWRAVSGTARFGEDFVPAEGSLNFPAGLDFRILYISLVNDGQREEDEQFRVELYDPAHRTLIGPVAETQVTIKDDD